MTKTEFTDKVASYEEKSGKKICDRHLHILWNDAEKLAPEWLDVLFASFFNDRETT